jgi:hypothetical protein
MGNTELFVKMLRESFGKLSIIGRDKSRQQFNYFTQKPKQHNPCTTTPAPNTGYRYSFDRLSIFGSEYSMSHPTQERFTGRAAKRLRHGVPESVSQ